MPWIPTQLLILFSLLAAVSLVMADTPPWPNPGGYSVPSFN